MNDPTLLSASFRGVSPSQSKSLIGGSFRHIFCLAAQISGSFFIKEERKPYEPPDSEEEEEGDVPKKL
jgi:hypothetical protein